VDRLLEAGMGATVHRLIGALFWLLAAGFIAGVTVFH
jgi:hypothetical protein